MARRWDWMARVRETRVEMLSPPLPSCMTSGKYLASLSPRLFICKVGTVSVPTH